MRFDGNEIIAVPREEVWAFITQPKAVSQCVPGLEKLEIIAPDRFRMVAAISMGTLQVDFNVLVTYDLLTAPQLANFSAVAVATGGNGEVRATSHITLSEQDKNSTQLAWVVNMTVVGLIANLAERLGVGLARHLTTQFFDCVRQTLQAASVS